MGTLRTEDSEGNVAYAIVEEEVEAIRKVQFLYLLLNY